MFEMFEICMCPSVNVKLQDSWRRRRKRRRRKGFCTAQYCCFLCYWNITEFSDCIRKNGFLGHILGAHKAMLIKDIAGGALHFIFLLKLGGLVLLAGSCIKGFIRNFRTLDTQCTKHKHF